MEAVGGWMPPANGAKAWDQPQPVRKKNENKDTGKIPEGFLHQVMPNDPIQKIVKALNHPLPEVLRPAGDFFHVLHRYPGKDNQAQGDNPAYDHRVGDGEFGAKPAAYLGSLLGDSLCLFL